MRFSQFTAWMLVFTGCFLTGCNKSPDKSGSNAAVPKANEPKPTDEKSEFPKITADTIAKEYSSDAKAVLVSGAITKKVGDASDRTYIVLKAGDAAIQCELAIIDDYTKFCIKTMKEGDAVSVLGEPDNSGFEAQPMGPKLLTMRFCKMIP